MSTHSVLDELEQQESVRQSLERPLAASKRIPSVAPMRYRALFEDSLLETGSRHRRRRTWPTILSFILQCFLVSVLVLVPLWYTDVLPRQQLATFLVAPASATSPTPASTGCGENNQGSERPAQWTTTDTEQHSVES